MKIRNEYLRMTAVMLLSIASITSYSYAQVGTQASGGASYPSFGGNGGSSSNVTGQNGNGAGSPNTTAGSSGTEISSSPSIGSDSPSLTESPSVNGQVTSNAGTTGRAVGGGVGISAGAGKR